MQIHVHHNGEQTGPYPIEEVNRRLAAGSLLHTDLAWHEGLKDWAPLSSIPGIGSHTPRPVTPGQPPSIHQTAPPAPAQKTSGLAIASLVLGILSFFSMGITSLPAVICGHMSRSRIKKSPERLSGSGIALAGLITGYFCLRSSLSACWRGSPSRCFTKSRKTPCPKNASRKRNRLD